MQVVSAPHAQHMLVKNDHDVISLRQAVRQMARTVGLGLSEQARITAAISEIARLFLVDSSTQFTIQITQQGHRPALEIECALPHISCSHRADVADEGQLCKEARSLADEDSLAIDEEGLRLILRMWISS